LTPARDVIRGGRIDYRRDFVAHSLSAKKRVRQNLKRRARNRARKDQIKESVKGFTAAITTGKLDVAETELRKAVQKLDRVAGKGTIHKNTAARKRSRLTKRLNAARAKATTGGGKAATGAKAGKGAGTTA
jgi:small subunit ribosomal protein S20